MKSLDSHGEMIKEINAFVAKLDPAVRLEAFKFLLAEEQTQTSKSNTIAHSGQTSKSERSLSPQEWLRNCNVSSSMDKALVLAYWLEEDQKKVSFTSLDLKDAFTAAREPVPANPSDVVAKLDGAGKVMKADKVGKSQSYRLTRTGIDQVQSWLNSPKEREDGPK
jgi:hypothetical protein